MLDKRTVRRIEQAFQTQPCFVCGEPSDRYKRSKYFCDGCTPQTRDRSHVEVHTVKDPKLNREKSV